MCATGGVPLKLIGVSSAGCDGVDATYCHGVTSAVVSFSFTREKCILIRERETEMLRQRWSIEL